MKNRSEAGDPRSRAVDRRRIELGRRGEDLAARTYVELGYRVVDRNWRCHEGELDLVIATADTIVFCEVKTRQSNRFGAPVDAVDHRKQRKLRRLAVAWFDAHRVTFSSPPELRFDVASVMLERGKEPIVEIIEGAF